MLTKEDKETIASPYKKNKKDSGNTAVQIALITGRINYLSQHLSKNSKDHASRLGLLKLVGQRRRLLNYLGQKDQDKYKKVITDLKLRK